ncbi:MAG: nuclear transport factor 2 family protein [Anaerolineales bacterium]|nr:nuclear transport factor 2 family protein [Anaerolineales bacterium]
MSPTRMSRVESALRLALAFHQARNRHDIPAMLALFSADAVFESFEPAPDGQVLTGRDALTQFWRDFFQASPRAKFESEDAFGLGEHAILRWCYQWAARDGSRQQLRGIEIFRVREGVICELRMYAKSTPEKIQFGRGE